MKKLNRLLLILFCACCFSVALNAQNNCGNPTTITGGLPYATPNHTTALPPFSQNDGLSTCGTVDEYNSGPRCGGNVPAGEDAVFLYTPTVGNECVTITLAGTGLNGAVLDSKATLSIMDGCPDLVSSNCIGQIINNGSATIVLSNLNLDVGGSYYIVVDGGTKCYGYKLTVSKGTCPGPPFTGGPGTDCGNPIEITLPYAKTPGSNKGKGAEYTAGTGCIQTGNNGEDVVYHFTLAAESCVRYQVSNMTSNGQFYLASGCPGQAGVTCIHSSPCRQPFCHGNIVEEYTLPAGDYYIILKGDQVTKPMDFDLEIEIGNPDDKVKCLTCNDEENCVSCKNSGFEKMTLEGWTGYLGYWTNPQQETKSHVGSLNNIDSRHTIMTKGNFDPVVPGLPATSPFGGDYSIRLGNDKINEDTTTAGDKKGDAEAISFTFVVDPTNTNFIYDYAVVLQSPGSSHSKTEQPAFTINLEVGGTKIACGSYEVTADSPDAEFINGPSIAPRNKNGVRSGQGGNGYQVIFRPWTRVNIPLLAYMGQTAKITFITKDCARDGHFGYAYVDARCEALKILRDSNLLCNPDTVHLTAPAGFKSYQWSNGKTTQEVDVFDKGVYTVTCKTVTNCEIILTTEIKYEKAPIPKFTWQFDCKDSTVTFTDQSTQVGDNKITKWFWSFGDGDTSNLQNPKHKYYTGGQKDIFLKLSSQADCVGDTIIKVPIDIYMPQGSPNAIDTIRLCEKMDLYLQSDSIELTKYEWKGPNGYTSSDVNPIKYNVLPKDSGYYKIKISIKNDCVIKNDSTYVIIEPLKVVMIAPDTIICQGDTAKLYCSGGKTYLWSPADSLSSTTITNPLAWPDQTTIYSVTMFNDLCPDTTVSVKVRVLSGAVSLEMPDTLRACKGGSITLPPSTNGFDTFDWNGPMSFKSKIAKPTVSKMDSSKIGYYIIDCSISTNTCLIGRDSAWLDLYPDPTINITPDPAIICENDTIQLTATGAVSYSWTPLTHISDWTVANPTVDPRVTTKYVVTGTSKDGCKSKDSVNVVVNPLPTPDLGPDIRLCLGDSVWLKIPQNYDSLQWTTGVTADSIQLKTDAVIGVTAYELGCVGYDTIEVIFQDPGLFTLGPDTLLCRGNTYYTAITVPGDSTFWNGIRMNNWSNIQSDSVNLIIDSTGAGPYDVVIYSGRCIYIDTIVVLFDSVPSFDMPDSIVCIGSTVLLDATHPRAHSYLWSTGATSAMITVDSTGNYWAKDSSDRCTYTDTSHITVVDPPLLQLVPDSVCLGNSSTFVSNVTGDTYLWSNNKTTKSITESVGGNYSLIVKYGPCTLYDTVTFYVQVPTPLNLGNDTVLCEDQPLTLNSSPGFTSWLWTPDGQTTSSISPTISGTYTLAATYELCTTVDAIKVTFDKIPVFDFPSGPKICYPDSTTLTAPGNAANAGTYLWSTNETTPSIRVNQGGFYKLLITNNTCNFMDSIFVDTVQPPLIYIGPDSLVCIGAGVRFGMEFPLSTYLWNSGETSPYIDKDTAGDFSLNLTYQDVCVVSDGAQLLVAKLPEPDLGPDLLICEGSVAQIFANTFGEHFTWNVPDTTNYITVSEAGTYKVTVQNGPCVSRDEINVAVQQQHRVLLPPDITICSNEHYDIVPVSDCTNPIYLWSTGDNSSSITVTTTGEYRLKVINNVCEAEDTIVVTVVPLPNVEPTLLFLCPDDSVIVSLPKEYTYYRAGTLEPYVDSVVYCKMEINLFMVDTNNCRWETSIKAEMDEDCERDIFVPNSFSPNGDGVNDYFFVESDNMHLIDLMIFNRWGQQLYYTKEPGRGWDGRFKDAILKSDVYEWKVIYENNYHTRKTARGHVNLLH